MEIKNKNRLLLALFVTICLPVILYFLGIIIPFYDDEMVGAYSGCDIKYAHNCWGFLHWFYTILSCAGWIILLIATWFDYCDEYKDIEFNLNINMKKYIKMFVICILLLIVIKFGIEVSKDMSNIYNKSIVYQNEYKQKTDERERFYDKMWKTYLQKDKITNLNKDMFIEVSKIIMENRRDGENITWKWLQENTQIPYDQFTMFYKDLSTFINSQRDSYYNLENQCQTIATNNNNMLQMFPNNMYNKLLDCPNIEYEFGFLSDSTNTVFSTKLENIK